MARKTKAATSRASSWWEERKKMQAVKKTKPARRKTKKVQTKKAERAEKGEIYYCDVCGCEIVCVESSAREIVCCDEPMLLVIK